MSDPSDNDSDREPEEQAALAAPHDRAEGGGPLVARPRSYHVPLSPAEVVARLREVPGLGAYESSMLPDFGGLVPDADAEYTMEIAGEHDLSVHCGPPAARGQSATGMLRLLYLRATLEPTEAGTRVTLRFAYRRPRWALQRWVGFLVLGSVGLAWVLVAPGDIVKKAMLYGALLLVLVPVIVHDLGRDKRLLEQRLALLNVMEHAFGSLELDDSPAEPYRKEMGPASENQQ